jgi:hypothetical protein
MMRWRKEERRERRSEERREEREEKRAINLQPVWT